MRQHGVQKNRQGAVLTATEIDNPSVAINTAPYYDSLLPHADAWGYLLLPYSRRRNAFPDLLIFFPSNSFINYFIMLSCFILFAIFILFFIIN